MKKLSALLIVFLLSAGFIFQAQALTLDELQDRGYIKVGIYAEIAPFTSKDKSGEFVGFDVDVIKKIAQEWGVDVKWVSIATWPENIPGLTSRRFDIFVAPFTITPKRARLILFSQPHFNAGQVIVVRSDERRIKSMKDLRGKTVAANKGSTSGETALSIKNAKKLLILDSQADVVNRVVNGEADAYIIDRPIALAEVKQYSGKLKIAGEPFTVEFYGYGINKEDTELLMQLNQIITILHDNGEWEKIFDKWFK